MCKQLIYSETGANVTIISKTFSCLLSKGFVNITMFFFVKVWIKYLIWQDTPHGINFWLV